METIQGVLLVLVVFAPMGYLVFACIIAKLARRIHVLQECNAAALEDNARLLAEWEKQSQEAKEAKAARECSTTQTEA